MQTKLLGATGLPVSRLALGTMTFGLQSDEHTAIAILDRATEAGINLLDLADVYPLGGDHSTVGRTEEIVGRWLEGKRQRFIVATKAVGKVGPAEWDEGASRKHLLAAIDGSLRRLRTDYVDLYQLHWDDTRTPLDETLEALDWIVRAGKARYIGVSNFLSYRLALALGKAEARQWTRFVSVQPRYNLLFREIERELLPLSREAGLGVIPYNPLAGGLLTGKHRVGAPTPNTRFTLGTAAQRYQDRYWHEREFRTMEAIERLATQSGHSLTTVSLAWVLANPDVTAPIIGVSRPEQLPELLKAVELPLDAQLKLRLDELTAEYRRGDAGR
ncbi:MAG TPA: aldo/keto reductase [Polyangiaceae bacterium]|nr:aldo/keto reductase [Polyangiaceae bacterium]